jgi:hypothetical protein
MSANPIIRIELSEEVKAAIDAVRDRLDAVTDRLAAIDREIESLKADAARPVETDIGHSDWCADLVLAPQVQGGVCERCGKKVA